ncbi:MAG TPA: MarR family winged helix-turn-helix transcriptional regulator [Tepidisphaeraceae bacterium]|nr:MarR family winged helix-turn-helix transcriptional regulator [Tepidisphaeraceae bacterium]
MTTPRSPAKRRHFDSPQQEAFLGLWRTYDRLRAIEDEVFNGHGLTAHQYNALRVLRAHRPDKVPTLGLGAMLVTGAPDITRLLDKLIERGLIERERPADNRRVVLVGITEAGLGLLDELARDVRESHARQLGHLGAADLKTLIDLLRKARGPHEPAGGDWG